MFRNEIMKLKELSNHKKVQSELNKHKIGLEKRSLGKRARMCCDGCCCFLGRFFCVARNIHNSTQERTKVRRENEREAKEGKRSVWKVLDEARKRGKKFCTLEARGGDCDDGGCGYSFGGKGKKATSLVFTTNKPGQG